MTLSDQLSPLPCLCFIDGRLRKIQISLPSILHQQQNAEIISFSRVKDFVLPYYSKLLACRSQKGMLNIYF
jgi:hypothetical protein